MENEFVFWEIQLAIQCKHPPPTRCNKHKHIPLLLSTLEVLQYRYPDSPQSHLQEAQYLTLYVQVYTSIQSVHSPLISTLLSSADIHTTRCIFSISASSKRRVHEARLSAHFLWHARRTCSQLLNRIPIVVNYFTHHNTTNNLSHRKQHQHGTDATSWVLSLVSGLLTLLGSDCLLTNKSTTKCLHLPNLGIVPILSANSHVRKK